MDGELKLKAFDEDDLIIISSLCQDSIIKEHEYGYDEKSKRFAILMNRFCHESNDQQRIRTAIHFDYVENLKTRNINKDDKDETLVLLAIKFDETKKPSGSITLEFSGNKAINLLVENIEVFLTDIGDPWVTNKKPDHNNE
ncbi:MAG: DUF2948 family protein [Pseudomonadota bacterium]|jgi:hypothetical protein|nr:DUF2948 family protein [Pseudomonadota bacterium]|tara:strand:- start:317 stop:739 length:423 start_codon:yes stop_codon:yes gene_type:complete